MRLLSKLGSNPKIQKSDKLGQYLTAVLHLAPSDLSGFDVCPFASNGCKAACLNTAGRGQMTRVQESRVAKTQFLFREREAFLAQIDKEISLHIKKCKRENRKPAVRLNGTSDIVWERVSGLIQKYPQVQFYDYTKIPARMKPDWNLPKNYYLTFSQNEENINHVVDVLQSGKNVAVVFAGEFPKTYLGFPVIDGTKHDLRFKDPKNVVVALKPIGKARRDQSGFVYQQP